MRLVVLAYQEVGCVCLESLLRAGADVRLVLTHEDDPRENIWFRSVGALAESAGLPVLTPADPNAPEVLEIVRACEPDFIFSFYYRRMLTRPFLDLARIGAYNLHGSLLPRYRGRAPVNWVLVRGETETGVTLHRMVARPDAGPIVAQIKTPIAETDDAAGLYAKIVKAAAGLMDQTWPSMAAGQFRETPQDESLASYFGGRRPEDGLIDWRRPAREIYNLCRAVTHPYPGAFTFHQGRRLYVWRAWYDETRTGTEPPGTVVGPAGSDGQPVSTGWGRLLVRAAQWEDGMELSASDLARAGLVPGVRFDPI
jgi:UDP-4-amino-4-deoxy-L-arabinose formyltransferase/UDP-glucuronic acid dehydrogenase (UDP-4-keto-hexauronic acid decarboxylating)